MAKEGSTWHGRSVSDPGDGSLKKWPVLLHRLFHQDLEIRPIWEAEDFGPEVAAG